jgi:hypothetical protein
MVPLDVKIRLTSPPDTQNGPDALQHRGAF